MKTLSVLFLTLLCAISATAQPWIGPVSGNIYYNQGNVGIGTTDPNYAKLDINGNLTFNGTRATPAYIYAQHGGDDSALFLKAGSTVGYFSQIEVAGWNGSGVASHIAFTTAGNATPRMYIQNDGNVGIGTTNPGTKLEVYGADDSVIAMITGEIASDGNPHYQSLGFGRTGYTYGKSEIRSNSKMGVTYKTDLSFLTTNGSVVLI
jgi:hypothetical protein